MSTTRTFDSVTWRIPNMDCAAEESEIRHALRDVAGEDRDRVVTALREEWQVGSGVYYPIPNHRLASLVPYAPGLELPETERAAREVISLPVHPSLTHEHLERIVAGVNALVKAGA